MLPAHAVPRLRRTPSAARRAAACLALLGAAACTGEDRTSLHPLARAGSGGLADEEGLDADTIPDGGGTSGISGSDRDASVLGALRLTRLDAPELSVPVSGCLLASPVAWDGGFLTAAADNVRSFTRDGVLRWSRRLPAPDGEKAFVVATPVLQGQQAFIAYHTIAAGAAFDVNTERLSQRVIALDASTGEVSPAYEPVLLEHVFESVDGAPVPFRADRALSRSALVLANDGGTTYLIVSFGNARDLQPWHGFAFALDLQRWRNQGGRAALAGQMTVTPESDCGAEGSSGSRERRCGGGLWAPSGPLVQRGPSGDALIFAPGNGQLDLARRDYANTLLRTSARLELAPRCGSACDAFDPDAPSAACAESCRDLFIPRDAPGDTFPLPESGACDGLTLFQCWQALDYVGGSTPVQLWFGGRELLAYPAKDGAVYLIDAEHLGRLYHRRQLVPICGTRQDPCAMDWAGMIVTQPALVERDPPLLIVPTFMPDRTHPAGVVGLSLVEGEAGPELAIAWRYPEHGAPEAVTMFREHPSRVAVTAIRASPVALLVEARRGGTGRLIALDAVRGTLLDAAPLQGPGYRFTLPLVMGDRVVVPSCAREAGPSHLELFSLDVR